MLCFSVRLILIEHDMPVRIAARSIQPQIEMHSCQVFGSFEHIEKRAEFPKELRFCAGSTSKYMRR